MHFTTLSNVPVRSCNAVLRFGFYLCVCICESVYVGCSHTDSQCSATSHKCAYQWMCQKRCRELIIHFAFLEEAAATSKGSAKCCGRGGGSKSTPTNSTSHSPIAKCMSNNRGLRRGNRVYYVTDCILIMTQTRYIFGPEVWHSKLPLA